MEIKVGKVYWLMMAVIARSFKAHKLDMSIPIRVMHTSVNTSLIQYICPVANDYVTKKVLNEEILEFPSLDMKATLITETPSKYSDRYGH